MSLGAAATVLAVLRGEVPDTVVAAAAGALS